MSKPLVCVVDASVAIKLYFAEPLTAEANALFACLADPASVFHVPDLFFAECANIFWKHVQRGTCTAAQAATHFADLAKLPLLNTPTRDVCAAALATALDNGISAYDACYVALAQLKTVSLITADQKLVKKLAGVSPPVIWLGSWTSFSGTLP